MKEEGRKPASQYRNKNPANGIKRSVVKALKRVKKTWHLFSIFIKPNQTQYPMFIRKITLLVCCILSINIAASACSCWGEPSFCGVLNSGSDWTLSHVIQAVKVKDTLHGMIVLPEKSYINEVVPNEPITVWGDPGWLCRIYTSNFEVGERLILGIKQMEYPQIEPEQAGDFFLSFCGLHFLRVADGIVTGTITENVNSMSLENFDAYMETEAYKENCPTIVNATSNINEINSIKIFPNPAKDIVTVLNETPEESIESISIYDSRGQLKTWQKYSAPKNNFTMDLSQLASGIYFVQIRMKDREVNQKIIIE